MGNDARDPNRAAGGGANEAQLSERLRRLDAALKARKGRGAVQDSGSSPVSSTQGMAQALRLSSEFVAGVVVGGGIGWLLDRFAGTSPWGLIVFLLLGFGAGVFNVLRSAGLMRKPGEAAGAGKTDGGIPPRD